MRIAISIFFMSMLVLSCQDNYAGAADDQSSLDIEAETV